MPGSSQLMLESVGTPITTQLVFPTFTEGEEPKFVPVISSEVAPDAEAGVTELTPGEEAAAKEKVEEEASHLQDFTRRDGEPSLPPGVMHWTMSGTAIRISQGWPPISTVVDPSLSQKPLPDMVIFCPP